MLFNLYLKGYYGLSGYFVIADNFYSFCKRNIIFIITSALLNFSGTISISYSSSITLIISTISNESNILSSTKVVHSLKSTSPLTPFNNLILKMNQ